MRPLAMAHAATALPLVYYVAGALHGIVLGLYTAILSAAAPPPPPPPIELETLPVTPPPVVLPTKVEDKVSARPSRSLRTLSSRVLSPTLAPLTSCLTDPPLHLAAQGRRGRGRNGKQHNGTSTPPSSTQLDSGCASPVSVASSGRSGRRR